MSDPKQISIPQWQRQGAAKDPQEPPKGSEKSDHAEKPPPSRASLLEQAAKFLEAEDIREAPTERKISFLESKGLTNEEIHKLVGISRNTGPGTAPFAPGRPPDQKTKASKPPQAIPGPDPPSTSSPQSRDIPPIITYPEFLLHSQKPPPPITARRLLTTFYVASGAAATIYGASKYLVTPMIDSLTTARHSLFETASSNVSTLNTKLEGIVSVIPDAHFPHHTKPHTQGGLDNDDASSTTSDPTELFHRDTGTQTSPQLPRSPSSTFSLDPSSPGTGAAPATIEAHHSRLSILHSHLSELLADNITRSDSDAQVSDRLDDLQSYLEALALGSSPYVQGYGAAGMIPGDTGEDEIAKVKAEIRGVKGVLLSARNFPGGVGRGRVGAS
ncbi:MAG: hypothetical protein FRX48_01750 [Lasallia pustulata]|uniref:Peroxisomal membrane protein PEX14 n=1 Tax=Lasallia pustulata TaxID=136370 RepID=A0A5M8PYX0_9LECA|nr:MAG: hypothetical protein FRX48_01750 [Lasallia pustulata]